MCALLSDRWREGYADPPSGIDLCLTDACDLRCRYCSLWGDQGLRPTPRFMETGWMLALVDQLSAFRPSIRLFGGESLLHPDWHQLVARARAQGMWSTAVSNGLRLAEQAEAMIRSGLLAIGISLDGIGEINDCNRGSRSFAQVRCGLEELERHKRRTGSETPWVEIYTTIQESNYHHLVDFAEELAGWGVWKYRLQHLIWCSSRQFRDSMRLLHAIDPAWEFYGDERSHIRDQSSGVDPEVLSAQLEKLSSRSWPFRIEVHPDIPIAEMKSYHTDPEYRRGAACRAMENYAFVDPLGTLRPCLHLEMGNVFAKPFPEVWNQERFRAFRRLVRREGRLPMCQRCPD